MAGYPSPTSTDTTSAEPASPTPTRLVDLRSTAQELVYHAAIRNLVIKQMQTNLRLCDEILSMDTFPMTYIHDMIIYCDQLWALLKVCQMVEFSNDPSKRVDGMIAALEDIITTPMAKLPNFEGTQQAVRSGRWFWMWPMAQALWGGSQAFGTSEDSELQKMKIFDQSSWSWVDAHVPEVQKNVPEAQKMMIFDHFSWAWVDADGPEMQKMGTFRPDDMEPV